MATLEQWEALMVGDELPTLAELLGRPEWMDKAACRGMDGFHPERGQDTRPAKAVCAGCFVRSACLDFALQHAPCPGIWGGTSERERRKMRLRVVA